MQYLGLTSIDPLGILSTSQKSTPLPSYTHYSPHEPSQRSRRLKEWIYYPFTVFKGREEFDGKIREMLLQGFTATICEIWTDARLSTKMFALQSLSSLGEKKSALKNWLRPKRRRMRQCKKKAE
ncbi:uncharacterized protein Bfra_008825 [Botrytis fragariae]|uniref:Uncharacterized protein n=1 Tax=Botrytis fragariae TaxID=1964551 RepID=A0A8H6EGZ4_9HELO|nr:uncharacterized protein Bfra_008825 [Botrytis fragariae]KAF5871801.1 hypothetical protein Bfra_008825 [Botrytis fragariae]